MVANLVTVCKMITLYNIEKVSFIAAADGRHGQLGRGQNLPFFASEAKRWIGAEKRLHSQRAFGGSYDIGAAVSRRRKVTYVERFLRPHCAIADSLCRRAIYPSPLLFAPSFRYFRRTSLIIGWSLLSFFLLIVKYTVVILIWYIQLEYLTIQ